MNVQDSTTFNKPTSTLPTRLESIQAVSQKLDGIYEHLKSMVQQGAEAGSTFDIVERAVFASVLQIGYQAMELLISLQGKGDLGASVTTQQGTLLMRSEEPMPTLIRSIFGQHRFEEYNYSPGKKRKVELRPISTRMELPENRWSYMLEEFSQMFCVDQAFGQASQNLSTVFGGKFSVDTLETTNARVGQQAHQFLHDLPTPKPASEGEILVSSVDGKGVPLVKQDAAQVAAFETAKLRPGNRRMAMVAAVYSAAPHIRTAEEVVAALFRDPVDESVDKAKRPMPQNKHVTAHLPSVVSDRCEVDGEGDDDCNDDDEVQEDSQVRINSIHNAFGWLVEQVIDRQRAGQAHVVIMDGQRSLWDAAAINFDGDRIEILDILHVAGYVWSAAKLLCKDEDSRKGFMRERMLRVLSGEAQGVVKGLRRMSSLQGLAGEQLKKLKQICGYLDKNRDRMKYDEYLCAGYPIASGVIEGACHHLVKDRMERSGMRWTLEGARSMLDVRACFQSTYWSDFHRERTVELGHRYHPHKQLLTSYPSAIMPT